MAFNLFRRKSDTRSRSAPGQAGEAAATSASGADEGLTPSVATPTATEVEASTGPAPAADLQEPVEFADEGRKGAPAPRRASARTTTLPAQAGSAQALRRMRRSNAIRQRRTGRPSPAQKASRGRSRSRTASRARPTRKRTGARKTNQGRRTSMRAR